jgi:peptidyl-prolyl cis-trans isomerase C
MSRTTFLSVLAVAAAVGLAGCKQGAASPKEAAEALGLNKDTPAAEANAVPAAEPAKPVPAELPSVVARVNGDAISKADFERAVQSLEQNRGPVPEEQRNRVFRGLLDNMVGVKLLRQEALARKVTVPDADVDARMEELKAQFGSEELFNEMLKTRKQTLDALRAEQRTDLAVNKMLTDALQAKVTATPEQIETFYKQNLSRMQVPEQVKASHILIAVPAGAEGITKDQARAKAEEVLKQVKAGKDFAALAKQYSQDPGSAVNGGDLGFFRQGQMVPQFDQVAFTLAPGSVSGLVETQFGFHIIKVLEKRAAQTAPLEEVRDQLKQFIENQNRQREVNAFIAGLRAKGKVEILI